MAKKQLTTFLGPNKGLSIAGDFAAAYTGAQASHTTKFTVLSFTTGNYLFVGEFQLNGAINLNDPTDINQTNATIKLNGNVVSLLTSGNGAIDAPMSQTQAVLIPANTEVTVEFDMDNISADRFATGS